LLPDPFQDGVDPMERDIIPGLKLLSPDLEEILLGDAFFLDLALDVGHLLLGGDPDRVIPWFSFFGFSISEGPSLLIP